MDNVFRELAEEMEAACGDWWNLPDNPDLTQRILNAAKEYEKKKKNHSADQSKKDGSSSDK